MLIWRSIRNPLYKNGEHVTQKSNGFILYIHLSWICINEEMFSFPVWYSNKNYVYYIYIYIYCVFNTCRLTSKEFKNRKKDLLVFLWRKICNFFCHHAVLFYFPINARWFVDWINSHGFESLINTFWSKMWSKYQEGTDTLYCTI